jgi:hypothetical protein
MNLLVRHNFILHIPIHTFDDLDYNNPIHYLWNLKMISLQTFNFKLKSYHVHNLLETNKLHNSSKDSSKFCTLYFFIQSLYTNAQMQSIHKMYVKLSFNTFNNLPKPTIEVQALCVHHLAIAISKCFSKTLHIFFPSQSLYTNAQMQGFTLTNAMHSPNVNSIFLLDFALALCLLSIFKLWWLAFNTL